MLLCASITSQSQQSMYDNELPSKSKVIESLEKMNSKSVEQITCNNISDYYKADVIIGKYVRSYTGKFPFSIEEFISTYKYSFAYYLDGRDSSIIVKCLYYIGQNINLFREVKDGWKGEFNFWEPDRSWYLRFNKLDSSCSSLLAVKFDIDFKDFIRQYNIDIGGKGKSCEQYINELIKRNGDAYRECYTDEDMKKWAPELEKTRLEFREGKRMLLEKYKNASFTKILQDIDETTIVDSYSCC